MGLKSRERGVDMFEKLKKDGWEVFNSGGNFYLGIKNFPTLNNGQAVVEISSDYATSYYWYDSNRLINSEEYKTHRFTDKFDAYELEVPLLERDAFENIVMLDQIHYSVDILQEIKEAVIVFNESERR